MKKLLLIALLVAGHTSLAQRIEYSFQPQSGLFSFSGGYTAKKTAFYINANDAGIYQDKHYGKTPGFSYSIEVTAKRVSRQQWIQGIGFSFESLQSKIDIDKVYAWGPVANVSGSAKLTNKFITLNPFVGKRIGIKKIAVDIIGGIDFAFCLSSHEKGQFQGSIGNPYLIDGNIDKPKFDIRPRIQLTVFYKKIGLLLGYSYGLTNYYNELARPDQEAFSRYLRMGISYLIK